MKPITKKPLKPASQRTAPKKSVGTSLAATAKKIAAGEKESKIEAAKVHAIAEAMVDSATTLDGKPAFTPAAAAPAPRTSVRALAEAVVADYDAGEDIKQAISALREFLAKPAKGEPKAREITPTQQKFLALCGRPEGATAGELAAAAGWPSIAARTTLQKLADRAGYTLSETPRTKERGIAFHVAKKAESLFA